MAQNTRGLSLIKFHHIYHTFQITALQAKLLLFPSPFSFVGKKSGEAGNKRGEEQVETQGM